MNTRSANTAFAVAIIATFLVGPSRPAWAQLPDSTPTEAHSSSARAVGPSCEPPQPGQTPSLGCAKQIEAYQNQIRKTTAACRAGKIDAEDCARNLKDYREAMDELGYHPR